MKHDEELIKKVFLKLTEHLKKGVIVLLVKKGVSGLKVTFEEATSSEKSKTGRKRKFLRSVTPAVFKELMERSNGYNKVNHIQHPRHRFPLCYLTVVLGLRAARTLLERFRSKSYVMFLDILEPKV